jgi:DNA-binding MarR family transcriptional regulator
MSSPTDPQPDPAKQLVDVVPAFERAYSRWVQSLIETEGGTRPARRRLLGVFPCPREAARSSPARMRLLGALHCKGPQIMSDLGGELGVTARQVTNLVDALEQEGLVRRVAHPTDRRATVIEATAQGAEQAERYWQPFLERLAGLYRELTVADQRELLRLLQALLDSLRRKGRDDP